MSSRRCSVPAVAWILQAALFILPPPTAAAQGCGEHEEVIDVLTGEWQPDSAVAVQNIVLERDVGRFELQDGRVYFLQPVRGRVVAAVFVGNGLFRFTPPTEVERSALARAVETPSFARSFATLFLLFTDGTAGALTGTPAPPVGARDRDAETAAREAKRSMEFLCDRKARFCHYSAMTAVLNDMETGFFHAQLRESAGRDPWYFQIDPAGLEEVTFGRRAKGTREKDLEVVTRFARVDAEQMSPSADGAGDHADRDLIHAEHYDIESRFTGGLDFSAEARVRVMPLRNGLRWVPFSLADVLEVDSVLLEDGTPAEFIKGKDSPALWVRFEPALSRDPRTLRVFYHGDLVTRRGNWSFIRATTDWYPRPAGRRGSTFTLTYRVPKQYAFASVGTQRSTVTERNTVVTTWDVSLPSANVSFNVGYFETYDFTDPRIPPVTVMVAEAAHRQLRNVLQQRDMEKQVGADVVNSLGFFRDVYGEPIVDRFYATEIPYFHGEAFPGLIHLSWITFQWTGEKGYDEIFRAHEMAHQWWGIGVGFESYRDQWLSEAFSEFSGLWYMQVVLLDNQKYFDVLRSWRDSLWARRDELGPVSLGVRNGSYESPDDYQLVVYSKGAWVLHMLRNLMLDLRTMDESRFRAMMREFYQTYRTRRASTTDFQEIVERHLGVSMQWFFDQWVDGTAMPTYRVAREVRQVEGGQYRIRIRVEQEGVPEGFQMLVPVRLDFGDEGVARLRLLVKGGVTDVELPPVAQQPRGVVFNDMESVLAQVRDADW